MPANPQLLHLLKVEEVNRPSGGALGSFGMLLGLTMIRVCLGLACGTALFGISATWSQMCLWRYSRMNVWMYSKKAKSKFEEQNNALVFCCVYRGWIWTVATIRMDNVVDIYTNRSACDSQSKSRMERTTKTDMQSRLLPSKKERHTQRHAGRHKYS